MIEMVDEGKKEPTFEEREHKAVTAERKATEAKKNLQASFAIIANAALDALATRARVVFFVVLMAGLFAYSMIDPSLLRVASATIFSLIMVLAGLFKRSSDGD